MGNKAGQIEYPSSAEKLLDMKQIVQSINACEADDLILIGVESVQPKTNPYQIESLLGKLRVSLHSIGQQMKVFKPFDSIETTSPIAFLWVQHFPLFEYGKDGSIQSCHHPFTAPLDITTTSEMEQCQELTKIQSSSCDLVLNGNEVGGGYVNSRGTDH